jgi:hypothetical protein
MIRACIAFFGGNNFATTNSRYVRVVREGQSVDCFGKVVT